MKTNFKAKKIFFIFISMMFSSFLFASVSHASLTDFITSADFYIDSSGHYPNGDSQYNAQSGNWVGSAFDPAYGEAQAAVKFDLSSLAGTVMVSNAQLKIYVNDLLGAPDLYKLYGSNSDTWQETATTIPSKDTLLNTNNGVIAKNQWITVNVTSFVQNQMSTDKIMSFVLTGNTSGDNSFNFNSKESSSNKPTLSVTYTILSNNANLSGLTLSSGTLSPAFAPATTSYSAAVPNSMASVNITPTVADSTATIKINSANATSGSPTSVKLNTGPNTITVLVMAQDGTVKTYTVIATLASVPITSITVTGAANAISVTMGSTLQMSAAVSPENATDASVTWSVLAGTGTATIDASGLLSATGIGTVTVKATAHDGSKIEGTKNITITALPVTSITVTGISNAISNGWYISDVTVTLATYDNPEVAKTEYRINGGNWIEYNGSISLIDNGIYIFDYHSIDKTGNVEVNKTVNIKIDKTAPVTKYHFDPIYDKTSSGRQYIKGFMTTLQATDNISGSGVKTTQYRINGGTWITYTAPFTFYAGITHTVEYFSTDNAGNVENPINKMDFDKGIFTGAGKY